MARTWDPIGVDKLIAVLAVTAQRCVWVQRIPWRVFMIIVGGVSKVAAVTDQVMKDLTHGLDIMELGD